MKLIDKYITESASESTIAKLIEKESGIKVKNITVKRKIIFQLSKPIDENNFDNFDKIDNIHGLLKKYYKQATTEHDWDKFIVEEL